MQPFKVSQSQPSGLTRSPWARTATLAALLTTSSLFGCNLGIAQGSYNQGEITIKYERVQDKTYQDVYNILTQTQAFNDIVTNLNDTFALPTNVLVKFTECGEENAFYDPSDRSIWMCYELIQRYVDILSEETESDEDYLAQVINAALFTFLHELGHALVDILELPITGKEEDVVDEFAAIMLLRGGEQEIEAVFSAMYQFELDAQEAEELEDEISYWGVHSLDLQRFYNLACFVYGSDPEEYAYFIEHEYLPEERAEVCEEEYARKERSWDILLGDYYN
ncbi:DUF4344 domain-containing metallopeptidase [Spirulina subsalsa]|uniref:DUF4344 domain-containing metallopeptidase n=1 Tax=Spirulina subsalsa TaxID=54311 RepID=UPI000302C1B4|nr:DUF4344 domain-containing metallopeptidase [Spirulina subsalsa]